MENYIKRIKEQRREAVLAALYLKDKKKPEDEEEPEDKKEVVVPLPNNWVHIVQIVKSSDIPAPVFSGNTLGHPLLNHALDKCVRFIVNDTGLPYREVQATILDELESNLLAKKSALSTVRFLRNADTSLFLDCPVCGTENEPGWESCDNCHNSNDKSKR